MPLKIRFFYHLDSLKLGTNFNFCMPFRYCNGSSLGVGRVFWSRRNNLYFIIGHIIISRMSYDSLMLLFEEEFKAISTKMSRERSCRAEIVKVRFHASTMYKLLKIYQQRGSSYNMFSRRVAQPLLTECFALGSFVVITEQYKKFDVPLVLATALCQSIKWVKYRHSCAKLM